MGRNVDIRKITNNIDKDEKEKSTEEMDLSY